MGFTEKLFVLSTSQIDISCRLQEPQAPVKKTAEEIQEEEELQLALAMSQSEAEAKSQKVQNKSWASVAAPKSALEKHAEPPSPQTNGSSAELDKYLNRQFWEDKQKETSAAISVAAPYEPSAPTPSSTPCKYGASVSSSLLSF